MYQGILIKDLLKGRSLLRSYQNRRAKFIKLSGYGIDLGAKSKEASYYEYLTVPIKDQIDFVDFYHSGNGIVQMDLENSFPIEEHRYRFAIAFNVLEHLYNHRSFFAEAFRILGEGGRLHVMIPFLHQVHPDPHDYARFTNEALLRLLRESGFEDWKIETTGAGPVKAAAAMLIPLLGRSALVRPLAVTAYLAAAFVDRMIARISPATVASFPLGYYVSARKPLASAGSTT